MYIRPTKALFHSALYTLFVILSSLGCLSQANAKTCKQYLNDNLKGSELLHNKDSKLHITPQIQRAAVRQLKTRSAISYSPVQKINAWLNSLNLSHQRAKKDKNYLNWFKSKIYDLYVIKPENIPESFFNLQVQMARDAGHGELRLTKPVRKNFIDVIIKDQKSSLDVWIDYFMSEDSEEYPMWFKFWAFQGLVKLGKFDDERGVFSKRNQNTTAPFADLNSEALSKITDNMLSHFRNESLSHIEDPEFRRLIEKQNFVELYNHEFRRIKNIILDLSSTEGEWRIFKKGSNPKILTKALEGKATGWCTAGIGFASNQIKQGDFHIYFSKDDKGNFTQPRIAIRMEDNNISEVRGIAKNQNLDDRISGANILEKKLDEFGQQGENYKTQSRHMRLLTNIKSKVDENIDLSIEELKFLYEFNEKIQGFGYSKDPRVQEIKSTRNVKEDLAKITGYPAHEIAMSFDDDNFTTAKVFYGDWKILDFHFDHVDFHSIDLFVGSISIRIADLKNVTFPKKVTGSIDLRDVRTIENVVLPTYVAGDLDIRNIYNAKNITFPNGLDKLKINEIESAQIMKFPRRVKELSIISARRGDANMLKPVGWTMPLEAEIINLSVDNANGLVFPTNTKLFFYRLMTYKGFVIPAGFTGTVQLPLLVDLENLIIPNGFSGTILFQNTLPNLNQLKIPKNFKGKIDSIKFFDNMPGNTSFGTIISQGFKFKV